MRSLLLPSFNLAVFNVCFFSQLWDFWKGNMWRVCPLAGWELFHIVWNVGPIVLLSGAYSVALSVTQLVGLCLSQ